MRLCFLSIEIGENGSYVNWYVRRNTEVYTNLFALVRRVRSENFIIALSSSYGRMIEGHKRQLRIQESLRVLMIVTQNVCRVECMEISSIRHDLSRALGTAAKF